MELKAAAIVGTFLSCLALCSGAPLSQGSSPAAAVATPAPAPALHHVVLADLLSLAGPYGTFLEYLTKTGVIKTFQSQANSTDQLGITVFAPEDSAFAAVDKAAMSNLTGDQLRSLMLHHATPRYYPLSAFSGLAAASTGLVPMFAYAVNVSDAAGKIRVVSRWATAKLVSSVYSTSPVAVYALDSVLLPEQIFTTAPEVAPLPAPAPAPATHGGKAMDGGAPVADGHDAKGSSCRAGTDPILVGYMVLVVFGFLMM